LNIQVSFDLSTNPDQGFVLYNIMEASDKSIWIGSRSGALRLKDGVVYLYSRKKIITMGKGGLNYWNGDDFLVSNIYEDKDRRIWLASVIGEIIKTDIVDGSEGAQRNWEYVSNYVGYSWVWSPILLQLQNRKLAVIGESGERTNINILNGKKWQTTSKEEFGSTFICHSILQTNDGAIWVGTLDKLHIKKDEVWKVYNRPKHNIPVGRLVLFEASDSTIWIVGERNEVVKIDYQTKKWQTWLGLNYHCETIDKKKWFISNNRKIVSFNPINNNWRQFDKSDNVIRAPVRLLTARTGEIVAAGSHNGAAAVSIYNGNEWQMEIFPEFAVNFDYRAVYEDFEGNIWLGAMETSKPEQSGGMIKLNLHSKNRWEILLPPRVKKSVQQIVRTKDGQIWLGCHDLYKFNGDSTAFVTEKIQYLRKNTHFILAANDTSLWVSARGYGLLKHRAGKWHSYNMSNGLPGLSANSIAEGTNGLIWANTENGITVFDGQYWRKDIFPDEIKAGRIEVSFLNFDSEGALWINNNIREWLWNIGSPFQKASENTDEFYTVRYKPDKKAPSTKITTDIKTVSSAGNITIFWEGKDYLNSTIDTRLVYSYKLDDLPWSKYRIQNYVQLISLASGKHTIKVRAQDQDLNSEKNPSIYFFEVQQPFWRSPLFIIMIIVIIIALITIVMTIIKQEHLKNLKLKLYTNISHEIRTPLTLIKTPLEEILRDESASGNFKSDLIMINRNVQRLHTLTTQLLDFNKIEAGSIKLELINGDIIRFINNVVNRFSQLAVSRNIDLICSCEKESLRVMLDKDKLQKILYNLLSNAFKYTPEKGQISICMRIFQKNDLPAKYNLKDTFKSRRIKQKKDKYLIQPSNNFVFIEIEVSDNGLGMHKDQINHLFERFYTDDKRSGNITGAHIGLAYTHDLVNLHNGHLQVESEPGQGSIFSVIIPYKKAPAKNDTITNDDTIKNKLAVDDTTEPSLDKKTELSDEPLVLVVEDEIDMQRLIVSILESQYRISVAGNGVDAYKIALKEIPDIIISDINMPQMDGKELIKKLKADSLTSHIPFIFLTVLSGYEDKIEGLESGADAFIGKPFHADELKIRINNLLKSRERWQKKFKKEPGLEIKSSSLGDLDKDFLERANQIIENNIPDEDFDYHVLAEKMNVSRTQLFRKIKAISGYSCNEYIRNIRLNKAAQLLRNSDESIAEIAYKVGFKHYTYFARQFKKYFKQSPKEYRS